MTMLVTCRRTSLARSLYGVGGSAILSVALAVFLLVVSLSPPDAVGVFLSLAILAFPIVCLWLLVDAATKPVLLHVSPDGIRVQSRAFLKGDFEISVGNISGVYHGRIKDKHQGDLHL